MPLVKVTIRKGKSREYKKAILDGVHNALVEGVKIPDSDRLQQVYELSDEDFEAPAKKTSNVTLIEITLFLGRSLEAKRKLYQLITENMAKNPGIASSNLTVVLYESPLENWCVKEGKPASEVDLGFKVKV